MAPDLLRELENQKALVRYMCEEIAAVLGLPVQTPADTVQSVRDLMQAAESLKAHAAFRAVPGLRE